MTQFMLSVHHSAGVHDAGNTYQSEEAMQAAFEAVDASNKQLMKDEQFVFAGGLLPPEAATVVHVDGTQAHGPVNSTGQLGGFWVIEVPNRETALAVAQRAARACDRSIEVRELQG